MISLKTTRSLNMKTLLMLLVLVSCSSTPPDDGWRDMDDQMIEEFLGELKENKDETKSSGKTKKTREPAKKKKIS
jgi:hypothetical protein